MRIVCIGELSCGNTQVTRVAGYNFGYQYFQHDHFIPIVGVGKRGAY